MSDDHVFSLRIELKTWEKQFAAENGGKKPGRSDVKNNAAIAAKYREYDRLRRPSRKAEAGDIKHTKTIQSTPKKKSAPTFTPQKANSQFLVPVLPEDQHEEELEPTPAAIRMHLGPTPQKDGQILSLFDDLPSTSPKPQPSRTALATIQGNVSSTPSKPSQLGLSLAESPPPENLHLNHTPASSSKRFLLDSFVSTPPLKRKRDDDDATVHATPSSSAKGLSTPAFLRRSSNMLIMDSLAEEAENDEEVQRLNTGRMRQPPFKKRSIVRSLSSIIQGLRRQEDDRLDEEMEMMRDLDEGEEPTVSERAIQVEDSQVAMPLGPDRAVESDESEEEDLNTGVFRKPWKKKGLKRQTKRVIMRPVIHKPKLPTQQSQTLSDAEASDEEDAVAETQMANPNDHVDSGSDAEYSDSEAKRKRQLSKTNTTTSTITSTTTKGDNVVKKAAKKISATAHANFRRLNIKNQNSKAKGRGRFGRR